MHTNTLLSVINRSPYFGISSLFSSKFISISSHSSDPSSSSSEGGFLERENKSAAPPITAPAAPPTDATTAVAPADSPAAPDQREQSLNHHKSEKCSWHFGNDTK